MQVVLSLRVGGLERVVLDLVQNASEEFRFVICCLEEPGAWGGEAPRVVTLGKRPGFDWRLFWKIARLARAEKVDVIHTHNSAAHLYGAIGGKLAGVKVLHTEHGKNLGQEARAFRLNRWAAHFTDLTVAVSEKIGREAREQEGVTADRLAVVANGICVDRFQLPRLTPGRRVGTVGRMVPEKNHALLLRAVAAIPNFELVFVGDGPLRGELEREAGPQAQFLGQRADIAKLLAGFDVFVLSSSTEGMSIALLEAMAAACPIVVTAVGGNTELIEHEVTGLVVPPDDATALRAAIERLLTDRELASCLGAAAREVARQRYSVAAMIQRYEELWRRLAA
ncbi:MAG TPA: glycosyltransferase [Verrucomicrobiae bacterium]|nr:glycosyltransferase [Verrucomicrobiae bacterium]